MQTDRLMKRYRAFGREFNARMAKSLHSDGTTGFFIGFILAMLLVVLAAEVAR